MNTLTSAYEQNTECIYCGVKKIRRKEQGDWKPGEKLAKGYYPNTFIYLICDNCKRSSVRDKTKCHTTKKEDT